MSPPLYEMIPAYLRGCLATNSQAKHAPCEKPTIKICEEGIPAATASCVVA